MNRRDKKKGKKSLLWILSRTKRLCYICWTIKPFRSENPVVSVQAEFWQLVLKKTFGQYYSELYFISFLSLIFSTLFPGQGQSVWGGSQRRHSYCYCIGIFWQLTLKLSKHLQRANNRGKVKISSTNATQSFQLPRRKGRLATMAHSGLPSR